MIPLYKTTMSPSPLPLHFSSFLSHPLISLSLALSLSLFSLSLSISIFSLSLLSSLFYFHPLLLTDVSNTFSPSSLSLTPFLFSPPLPHSHFSLSLSIILFLPIITWCIKHCTNTSCNSLDCDTDVCPSSLYNIFNRNITNSGTRSIWTKLLITCNGGHYNNREVH